MFVCKMAVNVQRLKLKQSPTDVWSTRERLCLASSVMRSGDQNWVSVSRAIRVFGEPNRPPDWFSQKNCALQYSDLLEKVETPKRKRGERGEIETPGESIIRKLTVEWIEELKKITQEERESYKKLQNEIEHISSGELDDKLHELWEEILENQRENERKAAEHTKWLQERESAKQAALALNKIKSMKQVKTLQPMTNLRSNSSQSEQGSEPESFVDSPLNDTQVQTEDDSNTSESVPLEPITSTPKPTSSSSSSLPPSTSPLLTSLLKSPTNTTPIPAFSILHSAITQSKEVPHSPVTTTTSATTISTLLNSSPSKTGLISHSSNDGESETIVKPTVVSPSAGAPTLSRLLEMPLVSPGKPLPPLPVVSVETVTSVTSSNNSIENEVVEDVTVESGEPSLTTETSVKNEQSMEEIEASIVESEPVSSSPTPEAKTTIEIQTKDDSEEVVDKEIMECIDNLMTTVENQDVSVIEISMISEDVPINEIEMESTAKDTVDVPLVVENSQHVETSQEKEISASNVNKQETDTTEAKEDVVEVQEEMVIQETVVLSDEAVTIEVPYEEVTVESEKTNSPITAAGEEVVEEESPAENQNKTQAKEIAPAKETEQTPVTRGKRGGRISRRSLNQVSTQKNEDSGKEENKTQPTDHPETEEKSIAMKEKDEKEKDEKEAENKKQEDKMKSKSSVREKSKEKEEEKVKHHRKKDLKEEKKDKKAEEKKDVKEDKKDEKKEEKKKIEEKERPKKEETREKRMEVKKRKFSKDDAGKDKKKEESSEKIKPKSEDSHHGDSKGKTRSEDPPNKDLKTKSKMEESQGKASKVKTKSEEPQSKESMTKLTRKGKEKEKDSGGGKDLTFVDTDEEKMSEKEEYSISSRHFPTDSIPNSPASNTLSDDQESLREYKVWKKAIMLVWRSAANHKFANVFLHPVTEEVAPGYHSVVIRPMDLSQIKKNIENGLIKTTGEFQRDMMLMFQNAIMYNSSDHDVFHMAVEMQKEVMRHIQDFLATQLMVQTAEISKSLRRETRELTHKRSSESQLEKSTEDGKRGSQEIEGNKAKKRRIARNTDD